MRLEFYRSVALRSDGFKQVQGEGGLPYARVTRLPWERFWQALG